MSIPGERLIVYFIDQLMQEVKRKRELLDGVEDKVDLLEGNLGMINAYLKDSEWEHYERCMATKVEVINQMRKIAFKAEHAIDKYIYHEIMQKRRNLVGKSIHYHELVDIAKTIAAKKMEMEEIDKNKGRYVPEGALQQQQQQQQQVDHHALAQRFLGRRIAENEEAVGLDDHIDTWVEQLTNPDYSKRDVLIMGMGGLGKSKLARKIYDRIVAAAVGGYFECWAWVYGYPELKSRDWLIKILESMQPPTRVDWLTMLVEIMQPKKGIREMDVEELAKTLSGRLQGKRYIVVLDGIWNSRNEWKTIESAFPDYQNGSRILITCREGVLTTSSPNQYCFLPLLNRADSWTLLCNKVFAGRGCHDKKLEDEGKALAADCKGLPLSIVVLGELLCENVLPGCTHSVKTWERYKQHVNSTLIHRPTRCFNILAESYRHLPPQLQSCFLYLSLFPEDFVFSVRHLTQLWSTEGLILDDSSVDLLDIAEECLTNLVNRSLIQVVTKDINEANVKTCGVHSILQELSRYRGESEKFIELRFDNDRASSKGRGRRLSIHGDIWKHICSTDYDSSSARSLLLFNETSTCPFDDETKYWKRVTESFRYVRVLYLWKVPIKFIPDEIGNLIFLTNITILGDNKLEIESISDSICNLEHLEIINIDGHVINCLPEIWRLKKLKHLRVSKGLRLPKPPKGSLKVHNLRILSGVAVEENMPHSLFTGVKKLHLVYAANNQNQQVDEAKREVDKAHQKFEEAQKEAEALKRAKKAQKKINKAEKKVNEAQGKVNEAQENAKEAQEKLEAQEFKLRTDAIKSLENLSALESLKINGFEKFDESFGYKFPSTLKKITFVSSYLDVNYLISILEKVSSLRILKVRGHYGSNVEQLRAGVESRFEALKISI